MVWFTEEVCLEQEQPFRVVRKEEISPGAVDVFRSLIMEWRR